MTEAVAMPSTSDDLLAECWIVETLAQAARQVRFDDGGPPPGWLLRVRDRLEGEFSDPITLHGLARDAKVHPSHLARAFRDHFGRTVGEYLRARRLRYARHRLEATDDPIAEIAFAAGFADQAHLTRTFAARWGHPPGRYRAMRRSRVARS
ncbi:MAG: AraC family transcriptional regulator [Candidatus Eisenbacteria bacterium]